MGIITKRDIVRILGSLEPFSLKVPLRELMSKPLITISPNNSIKDAMQTMQLKNIRRLPVVEKGRNNKMVGIITDKDIFRAILKNQNLITSFLSDHLPPEHKTLYEQFSEHWIGLPPLYLLAVGVIVLLYHRSSVLFCKIFSMGSNLLYTSTSVKQTLSLEYNPKLLIL